VRLLDVLFGRPLATSEERAEQIGPVKGIPVFGLDARIWRNHRTRDAESPRLRANALGPYFRPKRLKGRRELLRRDVDDRIRSATNLE
jgi:hypothetical protein